MNAAPPRVFEPRSAEELAAIVRETASDHLAVATIGAGTHLELGNPPRRSEVEIRTRGLTRLVEYTPEDQVVVVEAGITLGELQGELATHGQRLALDPPSGDRRTIGGLLATNAYGPSALRYGTLKDLIVGIEIVRADGAIAHGGGKVVKNVAGFDLSKLIVGSLGTLAIITKATFRLHPVPERRRSLRFEMPLENVFPLVLALRDAQLESASIVADVDGTGAVVEVLFEGFSRGVDAQYDRCVAIASDVIPRDVIPSVGAPEAPRSRGTASISLKATYPPSEFARVASECNGFLIRAYPSLGVLFLSGDDDKVVQLRNFFEALGGTLVVERMPRAWYERIDAWGTPPPSFPLMAALKDRFDPEHRLNPGRFVGRL